MKKAEWTEADILALRGREEAIDLEFKSGELFSADKNKWVAALSKRISGFANTVGGHLIIGIPEDGPKKGPRVAGPPDGVPEDFTREQVESLVETCISPPLTGLRIHRVRMPSLPARVVFVIYVPKGTTAYQANDGIYYGRSELQTKYLRDHEVRLRMAGGKIATARVDLRLSKVTLSTAQEEALRGQYALEIAAFRSDPAAAVKEHPEFVLHLLESRYAPDLLEFQIVLHNSGELTIRDPCVELRSRLSPTLADSLGVSFGLRSTRYNIDSVLYPGDERTIDSCRLSAKRDHTLALGDLVVAWKVFLDNSPPSQDEIDLASLLLHSRNREAGAPDAAQ